MKNPFSSLLHHYIFDWKLKAKLIISHTILFLLPMAVLTGFIIVRIYGIILTNTLNSARTISAQAVTSTENLITHIEYASDILRASLPVKKLFSIPKRGAPDAVISQDYVRELLHLVSTLTDGFLIQNIRIYYDDSAYHNLSAYNSNTQRIFIPLSAVDSPWLDSFSNRASSSLLCPEAYLTKTEVEEGGTLALMIRLPYEDSDGQEAAAYIAIYFSRPAFEDILSYDSTFEHETAFLVNRDGLLAAASSWDAAKAFSSAHALPFQEMLNQPERFSLVSYPDGSFYTACFSIKGTDWAMISIIPKLQAVLAAREIILQFSCFYIFIALLALFISYKLSKYTADRITQVALQMETIRTGRPKPLDLSNAGNDEIGVLSGAYNYMTEEIGLLMDNQEKAALELRRAEFRALQAQINPHFLYNTLDMINWLAQSGRTDKVTEAVQALTRFYRLTMGKKELINTIEDELSHVSLYMQLQNMRYDNCAQFVTDVPPQLYSCTIPKLTFQPIVENALLHGIMMKEEKRGTILITGWSEENDLIFVISDDGAGIPPEKLDTIFDANKKEDAQTPSWSRSSSYRHIGVYNTNLRLKSLYGSGYGLSFTSIPGKGTEVTVRIPAKGSGEEM